MPNDPTPDANGQQPAPIAPLKGCATSNKRPLTFMMLIVAICVTALFIIHNSKYKDIEIKFHGSLFLFAILGVVFHMAVKYREVRETGTFSPESYWFDHLFRAFQACLYVFIIDNWGGAQDTIHIEMAVVALLVGMYIRKVEVAFESLGDRIGEMIKALIGASSQQVSAERRKKRIGDLASRLDALRQQAAGFAQIAGTLPEDVHRHFLAARKQLQLDCPDEAEQIIQDIGLMLGKQGKAIWDLEPATGGDKGEQS